MNPHRVRLSPIILLLLAAATLFVAASCADKSSSEACRFETTMNLDKGNYDAVLASPCANAMQLGAAYFGKAGFNLTSVINTLIDAQNTTDTFSFYMTSLVTTVDDSTITNLDNAHEEYASIAPTDQLRKDSLFNLGLVDTIKGLSLLKMLLVQQGSASLNRSCDMNGNDKADAIDAASCVLLTSAGQPCPAGVVITTNVPGITLQGKSDTYRGVIVQVTGTGSSTNCPANNEYAKLLANASGTVATLTSQTCAETAPDTSRSWPCPLESNSASVDLVDSFNVSLDSAVRAMNESFSGGAAGDAQQSIYEVKEQNCCTEAGEIWNPADPGQCACDALELSNYFQQQ